MTPAVNLIPPACGGPTERVPKGRAVRRVRHSSRHQRQYIIIPSPRHPTLACLFRVSPGLNASQDCTGSHVWSGSGLASLCCGLRLGAAKDAIVHSVRYRESCVVQTAMWAYTGLPAALDLVSSQAVELRCAGC